METYLLMKELYPNEGGFRLLVMTNRTPVPASALSRIILQIVYSKINVFNVILILQENLEVFALRVVQLATSLIRTMDYIRARIPPFLK